MGEFIGAKRRLFGRRNQGSKGVCQSRDILVTAHLFQLLGTSIKKNQRWRPERGVLCRRWRALCFLRFVAVIFILYDSVTLIYESLYVCFCLLF